MNDFIFDSNSTKNQGRWRLIDPNEFKNNWTEVNTGHKGISYIMGILKNGEKAIQSIRFDRDYYTQEKASEWWEKNKNNYVKIWNENNWKEWEKNRDIKNKNKLELKPNRKQAFDISKTLALMFRLNYIEQKNITIDSKFISDSLFPVGSLRRGKDILGDIDIIITKQIYKKNIRFDNISYVTGGEKRIDFRFYKKNGYIKINLFIFLNPNTWGAALLHSTGSGFYNQLLRKKVKKNGCKLSQNGLIDKNGKLIKTYSERELQKKINVTERLPKDRNLKLK